MKQLLIILILNLLYQSMVLNGQPITLVIHGGAGSMSPETMSESRQSTYKNALKLALDEGYAMLEMGMSAEDAVIAVIRKLEDDSLFNCGRGSVLNHQGIVEMDASIMLGHDLNAGAVSGVQSIRNPILAADLVMHKSPHVMMSNEGAEAFAKTNGLETEPPSYFITQRSLETLKKVQDSESDQGAIQTLESDDSKFGTVGCVALDRSGNLAAGTSTGGMTNKLYNRIGDSPIIGAGTYANNQTCAVSCTGHGEYFIRLAVAHEVSALMMHRGFDLNKAAQFVIHKALNDLGGLGGLIAVDRRGNISMPFNTSGMYRAYKHSNGSEGVWIFKSESN